MPAKLGLNCKVHINGGTWGSPTWTEIEDVKDVTVSIEKGEADVTTRQNSGWKASVASLKSATVEFDYIINPDRANSAVDFAALRDAFLNGTNLDLWIADGASATAGTAGLRAVWQVMAMSDKQALEEAQTFSFTIRPTLSSNPPEWKVAA